MEIFQRDFPWNGTVRLDFDELHLEQLDDGYHRHYARQKIFVLSDKRTPLLRKRSKNISHETTWLWLLSILGTMNLSTLLFSAFFIILNDANMDAGQCRLYVFVARTRSFFEVRAVLPNLHSYDTRLYLKRSPGFEFSRFKSRRNQFILNPTNTRPSVFIRPKMTTT